MSNDLILTGVPRSGTSLVTALIDGLEDSLSLSEPPTHFQWVTEAADHKDYVRRILNDFVSTRARVLNGMPVFDRRDEGGRSFTNYYRSAPRQLRTRIPSSAQLSPVRKTTLSDAFLLAMKHNAPYTAVLPQLRDAFEGEIWAIVRNPVSTILSWRSIDELPINKGQLPTAARFWPEIAAFSDCPDTLEAQVKIYDLFCQRYLAVEGLRILTYESVVDDPGCLGRLLNRREVSMPTITNGLNKNAAYDFSDVDRIIAYISRYCEFAFRVYPDLPLRAEDWLSAQRIK